MKDIIHHGLCMIGYFIFWLRIHFDCGGQLNAGLLLVFFFPPNLTAIRNSITNFPRYLRDGKV